MCVWHLSGKEIGLRKSAEPVKIKVKLNAVFPRMKQYKLLSVAEEGMKLVIDQMIEQGILSEVLRSPEQSMQFTSDGNQKA